MAQVSISSDNSAPDNSAMLDVKSTSRGILIPRLTTEQRDALVNPATGLMIFNISLKSYDFFTGSQWQSINSAPDEGSSIGDMLVWNGTRWQPMTFKTYYADRDGDGQGDHFSAITGLSAPYGYVTNDCDEDDNTVSAPAFTPDTWYPDYDGDGFGNSVGIGVPSCFQPAGHINNNLDCDDSNPVIYQGAPEIQDGLDNNCDGQVDEQTIFYADNDLDGYGDINVSTLDWYPAPAGYVANSLDCNDNDYNTNPAIEFEACDGIDNNCDGNIDEFPVFIFIDYDGDGYGNYSIHEFWDCAQDLLPGYVNNFSDCNDGEASINPNVTEICDGLDNDCNGQVDDNITTISTFYQDQDQDGYGNPGITTQFPGCFPPAGYASNGMDCDDSDAGINPGQQEYCNGIDENCNGLIDEGISVDGDIYYEDYDGDGYGNEWMPATFCFPQSGWSTNALDCDDLNANIYPGAPEICDMMDNDCNFMVDDGLPTTTWYFDGDGDGYGSLSNFFEYCSQPPGYISNSSDCNDFNAGINPDAVEICDGLDNDCDGSTDEDLPLVTYYLDQDGDGYGDVNNSVATCVQPEGFVPDGTDCDVYDPSVNPGMSEICGDGIDNDCDGLIDELECIPN